MCDVYILSRTRHGRARHSLDYPNIVHCMSRYCIPSVPVVHYECAGGKFSLALGRTHEGRCPSADGRGPAAACSISLEGQELGGSLGPSRSRHRGRLATAQPARRRLHRRTAAELPFCAIECRPDENGWSARGVINANAHRTIIKAGRAAKLPAQSKKGT